MLNLTFTYMSTSEVSYSKKNELLLFYLFFGILIFYIASMTYPLMYYRP